MNRYVIWLVLLTSLHIHAYAQNITFSLRGEWRVDFPLTIERMEENEKKEFESLTGKVQENAFRSFHNRRYHLEDSGKIVIVIPVNGISKQVHGTWHTNTSLSSLSITAEGITRVFDVQWRNGTELRLVFRDVPPQAILHSLVLKKQ